MDPVRRLVSSIGAIELAAPAVEQRIECPREIRLRRRLGILDQDHHRIEVRLRRQKCAPDLLHGRLNFASRKLTRVLDEPRVGRTVAGPLANRRVRCRENFIRLSRGLEWLAQLEARPRAEVRSEWVLAATPEAALRAGSRLAYRRREDARLRAVLADALLAIVRRDLRASRRNPPVERAGAGVWRVTQ